MKGQRRLEASAPGRRRRGWLNALPPVQAILEERFQSYPINLENLLLWRKTGFRAWGDRHERLERLRELERFAAEYAKTNHAPLADGVAALANAKLLELLELVGDDASAEMPEAESAEVDPDEVAAGRTGADAGSAVESKWKRAADQLAKMATTLRALRATEQGAERLKQNEKRLKLAEEKLELQRVKDQRDAVSFALEILHDARAKEIEADPAVSYEQRIEILGQHIFGDLWKPRNIPGVVSLTPEQVAALYKTDAPSATPAVPATPKEDGGLRMEDGPAEGGKQNDSTAEARPANDVQHPRSKDHDFVNHADKDGWTQIKTKDGGSRMEDGQNQAEGEKRNGPTRPKADGLKRTKLG